MYKGDPATDPRSLRAGLSSNTRSWRSVTPMSNKTRSSKTVFYCLSLQSLDDVAIVDLDALRTSIGTLLDDTSEKDISLTFDQENGFVVMAVALTKSVESEQDLISKSFMKQVNMAFPESGINNFRITHGYVASSVFIYYRLMLQSGFVFDEMSKNSLNRAFMRVFGGRGYKQVDLQITSAGNQGQVRVNLRLTSRDVDTIIKSFLSNSFTSTLNRELQEDKLSLIRITDASTSVFEFVSKRQIGKVTVCYALNNRVTKYNSSKIVNCIIECVDNVNNRDVVLYYQELKPWTEMKVVIDNCDTGHMNVLETRLLSQNFIIRLNQVLRERGLIQYTISHAYLESHRDRAMRRYLNRDSRTSRYGDETHYVNSKSRKSSHHAILDNSYHALKDDTYETKGNATYGDIGYVSKGKEEEEERDCWMYCYFCCAFLLWFLPFIMCALLLGEVHNLRSEVDDLKDNVQLAEFQSTKAIDVSSMAWIWINGSLGCCGGQPVGTDQNRGDTGRGSRDTGGGRGTGDLYLPTVTPSARPTTTTTLEPSRKPTLRPTTTVEPSHIPTLQPTTTTLLPTSPPIITHTNSGTSTSSSSSNAHGNVVPWQPTVISTGSTSGSSTSTSTSTVGSSTTTMGTSTWGISTSATSSGTSSSSGTFSGINGNILGPAQTGDTGTIDGNIDSVITADISSFQGSVDSVQGEINALDGSVNAVSTETGKNTKSITTLNAEFSTLTGRFDTLQTQCDSTTARVNSLQQKCDTASSQITAVISAVTGTSRYSTFQDFVDGVVTSQDATQSNVASITSLQNNLQSNSESIQSLQASLQLVGSLQSSVQHLMLVQKQHTSQIQILQRTMESISNQQAGIDQIGSSRVVVYGSRQWNNGEGEVHCPTADYVATSCFVDFKGDHADFDLWAQPTSNDIPGCACGCTPLKGGNCATTATCKAQCVNFK